MATVMVVFAARYTPQLVLDLRARGRVRLAEAKPRARAWHISGLYALVLVTVIFRVVSQPVSLPRTLIALLLLVSGATWGLWALWHMRHNYSEEIVAFAEGSLVTTGPYHFVRHPLRLGMSVELVGLVVLGNAWMLTPAVVAVVWLQVARSRLEDQFLRECHGLSARLYHEATPPWSRQRFSNAVAGLLRMFRRRN